MEAKVNDSVTRTFSGAPWEPKISYCRAIRMGNTIAVTGTITLGDNGEIHAPNNPYEQTKKCLEIIETAIKPLGAELRNIIRTRIFITNIKHWQEIGRTHAEVFADYPPSTSMVEVKSLINPNASVEIEADAIVDMSRQCV